MIESKVRYYLGAYFVALGIYVSVSARVTACIALIADFQAESGV